MFSCESFTPAIPAFFSTHIVGNTPVLVSYFLSGNAHSYSHVLGFFSSDHGHCFYFIYLFFNLDFFISLFRVFPCFGFWVFFFFMSFVCAGRFEILFGLHYTTRIMVISPKDLGLWECSRKILSLISYKVF